MADKRARTSGKTSGRPDFDAYRVDNTGEDLTTNQGVRIADDQNSLRGGARGPTLLEDFILREKITHFDHERIPERVVHARGSAAHGVFELYESLGAYTRAGFLTDTSRTTPVFVRFSTVGGSRGSADTVRDVRGFAVKFYTDEGNYDLVGNNMPVFFVQDAIKFPDFVHAVKPEPRSEMPQASSAHDSFWDFCSLTQESTHMLMWLMSDRALPRSYAMMEGFGVHTYRLIDAAGAATFVKFHWKPVAGVHSLVWDEAQKLAGKNADFNRQDLWQSIEAGNFPQFELGVQLFTGKQADAFDFDVLDPTKLIPEELVPVKLIGKMTLNRNPDNFFAETEQVAFCVSHVVPGIDFSNDPLLQGRIFSYLDTQLSRLGGPNFHQLPINRPRCPFHNGQQDAMHQMEIKVSATNYEPNSIDDNFPREVPVDKGGFASYLETLQGDKRRVRAESFNDHFSQATLFWNSQSDVEKDHIVAAFGFELAKVTRPAIRARVVAQLANVDAGLAARVAAQIGLEAPAAPAIGKPGGKSGAKPAGKLGRKSAPASASPALSIFAHPGDGSIAGRKVAILAADGVDAAAVAAMQAALRKAGAQGLVLAPRLGTLAAATPGPAGAGAAGVAVDHTIVTMPSVVFDAVFVPGGAESARTLAANGDAVEFVAEAFKHLKAIAAAGEGRELLGRAGILTSLEEAPDPEMGVVATEKATLKTLVGPFIEAIAGHRAWPRAARIAVPA